MFKSFKELWLRPG